MDALFSFSAFCRRFPDDISCLEEIKKTRFPKGIYCKICKKITKHYKLQKRTAYSCKNCRTQCHPLQGTLFEKSSTPLRQWFLVLYLMTQTRGTVSCIQLQKELRVTYKTAWRMYATIHKLMELHNSDLLKDTLLPLQQAYKEHKWVFFNKLEIKVVQKQEPSENDT